MALALSNVEQRLELLADSLIHSLRFDREWSWSNREGIGSCCKTK